MRKIAPEERQDMRQAYVRKIINVVRSRGFLSLTIQDIADLMNMSRASLYNYFSSKEDIITEATNYCIAYIRDAEQMISNENLSYQIRLQKVFEQAVFSAYYASDIYLNDLKKSCTPLYEKKMQSRKERLAAIHTFYQKGIEAGIFNELNPAIVIMQDEAVLQKMLNSTYLTQEGLSLKQALSDYYEAKKVQILAPESLKSKDNEGIHEVVDHLLHRLAVT